MNEMTAKQIYDLWSTEIECLALIDLRPLDHYESARIPGAISKGVSDLKILLNRNDEDRLYVLIVDGSKKMLRIISELISRSENFIILTGGMKNWLSSSYPTAPLNYFESKIKGEIK
jgi:rhodanese-related sulfurtransferase